MFTLFLALCTETECGAGEALVTHAEDGLYLALSTSHFMFYLNFLVQLLFLFLVYKRVDGHYVRQLCIISYLIPRSELLNDLNIALSPLLGIFPCKLLTLEQQFEQDQHISRGLRTENLTRS